MRDLLNSERFQDSSPHQVYATLLDEGTYHCSIRTMYRILHEYDEVRERRNQRRHPSYTKPELLATEPEPIVVLGHHQAQRAGHLAALLSLCCSRCLQSLCGGLDDRRTVSLASWPNNLLLRAIASRELSYEQLTLHADRGSPMISKTVAQLLIDLGVGKSHSRPHTPDDNPFSEAQFKTMKYRPDYPARFGSIVEARRWTHAFFHWYNEEHHHSRLGLMTPAAVHYGQAAALTAQRQVTLKAAYEVHPERFVKGLPKPPKVPTEVWINPPQSDEKGGPYRSSRGCGYVGNWEVCSYPHIHQPMVSGEMLTNLSK